MRGFGRGAHSNGRRGTGHRYQYQLVRGESAAATVNMYPSEPADDEEESAVEICGDATSAIIDRGELRELRDCSRSWLFLEQVSSAKEEDHAGLSDLVEFAGLRGALLAATGKWELALDALPQARQDPDG